MLKELVARNRSFRRFYENEPVTLETLRELVELARLSPFGANRQSLKFFLSAGEYNEEIFESLSWAGYLSDWKGPETGERPAAYIITLNDTTIMSDAGVNTGIACQSILLGAVEKGLGGCMFGSVKRDELASKLGLPEHLKIDLVIALGRPKEQVVIDPVGKEGDIKYWRDENQVHHVPKRGLDEIIYPVCK